MLDLAFIRQNLELCQKAAADKRMPVDFDRLLTLDKSLRELTAQAEALRAERNTLSKLKAQGEERDNAIARVRAIKPELATLDADINSQRDELQAIMLTVPSIPAPEVPIGKDEADNVELRRVGTPPTFAFTPRDHIELAELHDMVDIPRAVKFAGSRSYFLKNDAVLLEMAICRFVLDFLSGKGFTPMTVPLMVKESAMRGTGYFPIGREQAYHITEDELFLIGTSEVSLVSCHQDEILDAATLPRKYAGYSTCFRREAGTYGKDTRGLYRVHQFTKVEQVIICENDPSTDVALHQEILHNTEAILQALELPYRVCLACTGEIGIGQTRKHEVETWMPSRDAYCETHSCSSFNEFQARRSNIRYRDTDGTLKYCYTLNNTGIASPRILIPLLENHQQADGSINIPKALRPYMNGREVITL